MRLFLVVLIFVLTIFNMNCQSQHQKKIEVKGKTMYLQSSAFKQGEMIPARYTCKGEDVSPPLSWNDAPQGTKTFALIADDPDAPMGTWVHWVIYNIPASVKSLPEGVAPERKLKDGTLQGLNDFRKIGYGGPCPPSGVHRYFFKLYALDTKLDLPAGATKAELLNVMKGHILAQAELMGKFAK